MNENLSEIYSAAMDQALGLQKISWKATAELMDNYQETLRKTKVLLPVYPFLFWW